MASHDVAWDAFRQELRHWMEVRGLSNRELASHLRDVMHTDVETIDEFIVKRWRHSTSPPLGALRHIAEILAMSADLTGNAPYDPTYLLRRMGLLAPEVNTNELFDTAYRLQELRLRLMDVRNQLSEHTARNGVGTLIQVAVAQGFAAAAYPVWDGPTGYLMHVSDRIDFRHSSDQEISALDNPALRAALTTNFAVKGERRPRFSNADEDLSSQDHWAIPLIGRPFTRAGQALHPRIPAIAISSTTNMAWPDVGAALAWLLGYGFASTREIARELMPEPISSERLRNEIHSQFLVHPPQRHVWSHYSVSFDSSSEFSPWCGTRDGLDPGILHIRLVESDEALAVAGPWLASSLARDEEEVVAQARLRRDEALERRETEALEDSRERMVLIDVGHYESSSERWDQAMRCVMGAMEAIANLGVMPDLTPIHDRFLRNEPEIAPGLLRWLADHGCPLVNPKYSALDDPQRVPRHPFGKPARDDSHRA